MIYLFVAAIIIINVVTISLLRKSYKLLEEMQESLDRQLDRVEYRMETLEKKCIRCTKSETSTLFEKAKKKKDVE